MIGDDLLQNKIVKVPMLKMYKRLSAPKIQIGDRKNVKDLETTRNI